MTTASQAPFTPTPPTATSGTMVGEAGGILGVSRAKVAVEGPAKGLGPFGLGASLQCRNSGEARKWER